MPVLPGIVALCRAGIEPGWKRALRALLQPAVAWRLGLYRAGEGLHWGRGARVRGAWIGRHAAFGPGAAFCGPVVIGDLTMLSNGVQVIGQDHVADDPARPMRLAFPHDPRPVTVIEADCWIGSRVTIMEGLRIGRGSIIAAGAVVTRPVPPYSVMAGVPARPIRRRLDPEAARRHDILLYGRPLPLGEAP
ncbi:MAG: acyltransferase [Rubellimicrobium sp.]|nr:acyltransferase [Rubellimicrobium sp.]